MRIDQGYYGDYKITCEMPFDLESIRLAANKILVIDGVAVFHWPVNVELVNGYWELHFTRPVTDEVYENMRAVQATPGAHV